MEGVRCPLCGGSEVSCVERVRCQGGETERRVRRMKAGYGDNESRVGRMKAGWYHPATLL